MVHYTLDFETNEWKLKLAKKVSGKKYCIQDLKVELLCIIKFEETIEIEHKFYFPNQIHLALQYLLDEYTETKKPIKVFSHNLDFDIKFFFNLLTKNHLILKPIYKNRLISLRCLAKSKYLNAKGLPIHKLIIDFRDSFSIIPLSIEKIGKIVKFSKLENSDNLEKKMEYCYRDCLILNKGLSEICNLFSKFQYETTIEKIPSTIPSLSIKLFIKKNKNLEIEKETKSGTIIKKNQLFEISKQTNDYFRKSYYGGKVECYNFNITTNTNFYDKNSTYQNIMFNNNYPVPPYIKAKTRLESDISNLTFAIEAEIDESNSWNPLIPERIKLNNTIGTFYLAQIHIAKILIGILRDLR